MSAYDGEFIYLFQHYFSAYSMSIKNLITVGNIAQKKQKTSQWKWNETYPLTYKKGGGVHPP